MGLTMLRIDRSKLKWKIKLQGAFDKKENPELGDKDKKEGKRSKWTLFLLPFITVLREGLEAVVFIGGVSLGQSAKSIPLAAITGLICGLIVGCRSSGALQLFLADSLASIQGSSTPRAPA